MWQSHESICTHPAHTQERLLLVDAAKIIHSGLPKRLAVHVAVVEPLTDDLQTIDALKDLCNLMI